MAHIYKYIYVCIVYLRALAFSDQSIHGGTMITAMVREHRISKASMAEP